MIHLLPIWGSAALFLVVVMSAAWVVQRRTLQGAWADVFWSLGLGVAGMGVSLAPVDGATVSMSLRCCTVRPPHAVVNGVRGVRRQNRS